MSHAAFFSGEAALSNGVYYLALPNGNPFGYYSYLTDPHYVYHFDLSYEYVIDANDAQGSVYFYDFATGHWWYTSRTFSFPYLYDFSLNALLYYFPAATAGHYTTNPRYFYNFATSQIITLPSPAPAAYPTFTPLPSYSGFPSHLGDPVTVGPLQVVEPAGALGFYEWADEPLSVLRQPDGTFRMWTNGNSGTAAFSTPDLTTLSSLRGAGMEAFPVSGAGGPAFDADYAGAGTVFPASNGRDLLMIYSAEYHYGIAGTTFPAAASIGLARSSDNGTTWQRAGQIITSHVPPPATNPGGLVYSGAGNPTALLAGGYIYVFFDDAVHAQGGSTVPLAVARAPLASDGAPGAWLKYYHGAFTEPGLGGNEDNVEPALGGQYFANGHHVSYNAYLNAYLLFTEGAVGYYFSTSTDLVHWSTGREIAPAVVGLAGVVSNPVLVGHTPYALGGALVSPDQAANEVTGQSGFIYYSSLDANGHHSLVRQSFVFGTRSDILSIMPANVNVPGLGTTSAQGVSVAGGTAPYHESDTCAGKVSFTTTSGGFLLTGLATGSCGATIFDSAGHSAPLSILITITNITVRRT